MRVSKSVLISRPGTISSGDCGSGKAVIGQERSVTIGRVAPRMRSTESISWFVSDSAPYVSPQTRSVTERRRHLSGMRQESDSVSELSVALTDPAQVCGYADHRQVPGLSVQKMAH